jgi:hypothetical protein
MGSISASVAPENVLPLVDLARWSTDIEVGFIRAYGVV